MTKEEILNTVTYFVPDNRNGLLPCVECNRQTPNSLQAGNLWLRPLCPIHDIKEVSERLLKYYICLHQQH